MKYYFIILVILLGNATFAWAETPSEAIATLSADAQQWVNQSCSRSLGPSLWSSCVMREVAALRSGIPDMSDMSDLNAENQSWIRASCSPSLGPNLTISCMHREIEAIKAGIPDLSDLSTEQRTWLQQSCSRSLGPSLYRSCVLRERAALTNSNKPLSAPPARVSPPPTDGTSHRGYLIEVAHNDELFIINGEKYEAKTYCLGWEEGEEVMFLEGSAFGACASAKLLNLNRKEVCEVWCE